MTVRNITYSTTLIAVTCGACGIPFGLPENVYAARRDDGGKFYCPNGHYIGYGTSAADKLRTENKRLLDLAERRLAGLYAAQDQAQAAERRRAAAKGQLTKVKKRVAAGVCPCCNRTFQNLADHMAGQHPDYAETTT